MPIQITPTEGVLLEGDVGDVVMQLYGKVVLPLVDHIRDREGVLGVVNFYAYMMTHLALDANAVLGTSLADTIIDAARTQMHRAPTVESLPACVFAPEGKPH